MPTVDLITYCCPKDIHRTYAGFGALVDSHKYQFHEIMLIRHMCRDIDVGVALSRPCRILETEDYPNIISEFGIDENDPEAERVSSSNNRYYWKMTFNAFIGLKESSADYIAFTDCDNLLEGDVPGNSWVDRGLHILQTQSDVFMICPNQWHAQQGDMRVEAISQCTFLCERQRFIELDYNAPLPPGVELGGFHVMLEGRLWRYARKYNVCRVMLQGPPLLIHLAW